jgi:hypothetical protein
MGMLPHKESPPTLPRLPAQEDKCFSTSSSGGKGKATMNHIDCIHEKALDKARHTLLVSPFLRLIASLWAVGQKSSILKPSEPLLSLFRPSHGSYHDDGGRRKGRPLLSWGRPHKAAA